MGEGRNLLEDTIMTDSYQHNIYDNPKGEQY